MREVVGIDIGGTKIAAGIITETGQVRHEVKVASNTSDREAMYHSLCEAIERVLPESPAEELAFGIGVPGLVDRKQGIAVFQNNLPWENFPLMERLRESYPQLTKVTLDNDVYQAAFAEWKQSGLGPEDTLVLLTVSTGISCSIITGGKFLRGNGFAGELGLLPVISPQKDASVTRLEKVASGPALAEFGKEAYNDGMVTAEEIFLRFRKQDPIAIKLVNDWLDSMVHGIYAIICLLDPQKIVFAGSVMKYNPDLLVLLKEKLRQELIPAQSHSLDILEISHYDNNAGLIGAGLSAFEE